MEAICASSLNLCESQIKNSGLLGKIFHDFQRRMTLHESQNAHLTHGTLAVMIKDYLCTVFPQNLQLD